MPIDALTTVEQYLKANFKIKDWEAVRIIFACAAALYHPGEMLWLRFVGASRSGKTELLRAIDSHDDSESLGVLTPSAIRGGLKVHRKKLFKRLDGKRVITFDLSGILTTRKDARNEIFGLFRLMKDGKIVSDFDSSEGHLSQEGRFDWLMGTTQAFEQSRVMESLLGERFVDLWWVPDDREEMAIRATENNQKLDTIRKELAEYVSDMLDYAKLQSKSSTPNTLDNEWLGKVGDIAALLRSPILKDKWGNIVTLPQPEIGTDLAQSFQKVGLGLKSIRIDDYQPYIRRLARDCIPSIRRKLVAILVSVPNPVKVADIVSRLVLPESTVRYHLVDLEALRIVEKTSDNYTLKQREKVERLWF